jgi:hypothetical protein
VLLQPLRLVVYSVPPLLPRLVVCLGLLHRRHRLLLVVCLALLLPLLLAVYLVQVRQLIIRLHCWYNWYLFYMNMYFCGMGSHCFFVSTIF